VAIILMEKEVKHYTKNKDNKKRRNMKKRKTKPNKYTLLHRSNERFARNNLQLLSENAKLKDDLVVAEKKLDDITQVKESIQLANQTLEKRLLATEVELLRKIVSLYEKQPVQQPIVYNYPNSNGVSTTGTTITTASNTINGY
jgi:hypothetical protein|tara:strand:+ start:411 stop:839 length:429 start_codon:yes stop_codon:yes gene_type:complete